MSSPLPDDDEPLDPIATHFVRRARMLMVISAVTTLVAVAAVLGVIGYRVFKAGGSGPPPELTALLPKGARVVAITAAEDRLVVTVEFNGALEARMFDLHTLKPAGRLRFATEP
jgi:hypothetical protein